jgi:hypothetical protein
MTDEQRSQIVGLGCLAVFACIILLLYYTFSDNPKAPQEIDSTGYISHKVESTITADPSWINGESRTCISHPLDAQSASELDKPAGYALWGLDCSGGDWHRITITFWGSTVQPGKKAAYWNCTRTSDSFTCKQTGAY